jgi:hypothetical protein
MPPLAVRSSGARAGGAKGLVNRPAGATSRNNEVPIAGSTPRYNETARAAALHVRAKSVMNALSSVAMGSVSGSGIDDRF